MPSRLPLISCQLGNPGLVERAPRPLRFGWKIPQSNVARFAQEVLVARYEDASSCARVSD
jgi:hypothetical protein